MSRPLPSLLLLLPGLAGCEELPRTYSTRAEDGVVLFRDDFERSELGPEWIQTGPGATLEHGLLKLEDLHNHPVWLERALPDDLRVEFDAWATTEEGDVKVELAGDGRSVALARRLGERRQLGLGVRPLHCHHSASRRGHRRVLAAGGCLAIRDAAARL